MGLNLKTAPQRPYRIHWISKKICHRKTCIQNFSNIFRKIQLRKSTGFHDRCALQKFFYFFHQHRKGNFLQKSSPMLSCLSMILRSIIIIKSWIYKKILGHRPLFRHSPSTKIIRCKKYLAKKIVW